MFDSDRRLKPRREPIHRLPLRSWKRARTSSLSSPSPPCQMLDACRHRHRAISPCTRMKPPPRVPTHSAPLRSISSPRPAPLRRATAPLLDASVPTMRNASCEIADPHRAGRILRHVGIAPGFDRAETGVLRRRGDTDPSPCPPTVDLENQHRNPSTGRARQSVGLADDAPALAVVGGQSAEDWPPRWSRAASSHDGVDVALRQSILGREPSGRAIGRSRATPPTVPKPTHRLPSRAARMAAMRSSGSGCRPFHGTNSDPSNRTRPVRVPSHR